MTRSMLFSLPNRSRVMTYLRTILSEILIVVILAFMTLALLNRFSHQSTAPSAPSSDSQQTEEAIRDWAYVGAKVVKGSLPFENHSVTLVLVGSPTCIYCRQSVRFHSAVNNAARQSGVGFVVAVPTLAKAAAYTTALGVDSSATLPWSALGLQVEGTPTLLAVDSAGTVTRVWSGKSNDTDQKEILHLVSHPSEMASPLSASVDGVIPNYSAADLLALKTTVPYDIIDVAEHGVRTSTYSTIHIPQSELQIRSPYELSSSSLHVIDCSNMNVGACREAAIELKQQSFRVATLGVGSSSASCVFSRTH
jgi:hypothetical protein